ncbi:MAG: acyl--CoA ligase [Oscillospiraceae bacterium]|nr:acyl--CoA ligase [Oscillospiraceae bacterium]
MRFSGFEELLSHYALASPDAPALIYEDDGEIKTCSYSVLHQTVTACAESFRSSGKRCIGILSDGSFDCLVTILAANIAGMQIVMLDANAPLSLLKGSIPYTDIDTLWGDEELCEELSPLLTSGPAGEHADRILFFTSGTTSSSKAVVLTGQSLMSSAWNGSQKLPLSSSDTLLCMLPLGHVFGFVCGLLWGLSCGASVALGRGARHYMDDCLTFRPTALSVVPSLLAFLLGHDCLNSSLRVILVGAGDCQSELLSAVTAKDIRVSFGYGLTETSSGVAISIKGDPFAMEICPDNEITIANDGEILIKAPTCMMQGYYKMPEATAEAITDGVLHSGDLGYLDAEGLLHITGRKKDILVLADGTKIFLPEYEAKLSSVLGTAELAVLLKSGRPVLVVSDDMLTEEEIRRKIRPILDEYPRGQQITEIILRSAPIPRTATGKIQRYRINLH